MRKPRHFLLLCAIVMMLSKRAENFMLSRLKPVSCLFQRMLGSINLENGLERESRNAQPTKLVKRKVALVIAYVGSNYYGLQMDRNSSLPTVEATLEQELYALGHIRESNHKELGKIHWSRSSRTDKKVHAAKLVVSVKLEIDPLLLSDVETYQSIPSIAAALNARLPDDIRVLSCTKINAGFRARQACQWREYEYVFPLSLLSADLKHISKSALIDDLSRALRKFEGSKSFHNFHKMSKKDIRKAMNPKAKFHKSTSSDEESDDDEGDGFDDNTAIDEVEDGAAMVKVGVDGTTEESSPADRTVNDAKTVYRSNVFDNFSRNPRDIVAKTRCNIYKSEVTGTYERDGVELVKLRICGQSFLLHQIRLMVGTAIAAVRGVVPKTTIDTALVVPYHIPLPMAPAEGLLLTDAGFASGPNSPSVVLTPHAANSGDLLLLPENEFQISQHFKTEYIYRRVEQDWLSESGALASSWLTDCSRYQVPPSLAEEWAVDLASALAATVELDLNSAEKERNRVIRMIERFKFVMEQEQEQREKKSEDKYLLHPSEGTNEADLDRFYSEWPQLQPSNSERARSSLPPLSSSSSSGKKQTAGDVFGHRVFLPNTVATELTLRFRLYPSDDIPLALRVLATLMVDGELSPSMTVTDIMDWVEGQGGWKWLINQQAHPQID